MTSENMPEHKSQVCSLQMCEEEAIQWLDLVDQPKVIYLCEAHTINSDEFPEAGVYSCDEDCNVCKHN